MPTIRTVGDVQRLFADLDPRLPLAMGDREAGFNLCEFMVTWERGDSLDNLPEAIVFECRKIKQEGRAVYVYEQDPLPQG